MTVAPPSRRRQARIAPHDLVRPVVAGLPPAATGLFTLLTVAPAARQPLFRHVGLAAESVDRARTAAAEQLTNVSALHRAATVRVIQSSSLVVRVMVAAGLVAAEGRPGELPPSCADHARRTVELAERAMRLTVPPPRGSSVDEAATQQRLEEIVGEMSATLDRLMHDLVAPAVARTPHPAGVAARSPLTGPSC